MSATNSICLTVDVKTEFAIYQLDRTMNVQWDLFQLSESRFKAVIGKTRKQMQGLRRQLEAEKRRFQQSQGCHFGTIDTSGKLSQSTEERRYHGAFRCVNGSNDTTMPMLREIVQNMVDAIRRQSAASSLRGSAKFKTIGNLLVCGDDGCGMTYSELEDQFLTSARSNKRGTSADGGHGIGRRLILFRHNGWMLATNALLVIGAHERFLVHCRFCNDTLCGEECSKSSCRKAAKTTKHGTQLALNLNKPAEAYMQKAMDHMAALFMVKGISMTLNEEQIVPSSRAWPAPIEEHELFTVHPCAHEVQDALVAHVR